MNRKLFWLTTISLLAVLAFSGTVFADGEETPAVPTEEPAVAVVVAAPTENPVVIVAETPPAVVEPAPGVPSVDQTVPVQPIQVNEATAPVVQDPASLVEAVPAAPTADSQIAAPAAPVADSQTASPAAAETEAASAAPVLADASGEPLNMASQASADLISNGDSYWFVGTHKYATVFNLIDCPSGTIAGTTCWASATPINDALDRIESGGATLLPSNRKLYVVGGTAFTENVLIDGGNPGDFYKSQLNGFLGIDDGSGNFPVLNGYIDLNEMNSGFTLSDFTINNGYFSIKNSDATVLVKRVKVHNTAGSGIVIGDETAGVYTRHNGNVTLSEVTSNNNAGSGAEIYIDGALSIDKSAFNFNGVDGLTINTLSGKISMADITAIGNQDFNVDISRFQNKLSIKNAVLNDSQNDGGLYAFANNSSSITLDTVTINNNDDYGMYLQTNGPITLTNVDVSNSVNNYGAYLYRPQGLTPILVTDSSFNYNGLSSSGSGLEIFTKGDVILTSIEASGNNNDGLYIDNCLEAFGQCLGSGVVTLTTPNYGSFMSANSFENNGDDGIEIYSEGIVSLADFVSNNNGDEGVYVENRLGDTEDYVLITTSLPYWINTTDNNAGDGINIWTKGAINVLNTNSSDNGGDGLYVANKPYFVLVSDGEYFNNLTGLYISTKSAITLDGVKADDNTNYGMYLVVDDDDQVSLVSSEATGNANGIYVSTDGNVVFSTVKASGNTGYGAQVEACLPGDCDNDANFSLYGNGSYFDNNGTFGLDVTAFGGIGLTSVGASGNGTYGIQLNNVFTDLDNGVNINNGDDFSIDDNGSLGLQVNTNGTITLGHVEASNNSTYGAWLDNSTAETAKALILNSCTFEDNGSTGLYADIYGPISAYSLRASYNTGSGADLNNSHGSVLVTYGDRGLSRFLDNGVNGLDIDSTHAVSVKNLKADLNGNIGVLVNSDSNVTITGNHPVRSTTFLQNGVDGLDVYADGTITINGTIQVNDNGATGIYLDNQTAITSKKISVSNTETNDNGFRGLWIAGNGAVTLAKVESQFNGDSGVYVDNESGDSGTVTVTGTSLTSNNDGRGLEIYTDKAAVVSNVKADLNGDSGIYIESNNGTTKLTNLLTRMNSNNGVEIVAMNNVVLNNVRSLNNGDTITYGDGLLINSNDYDVTIQNSAFHGNFGYGIDAAVGLGDLVLKSTSYVGNDASNTGFFIDLYVH